MEGKKDNKWEKQYFFDFIIISWKITNDIKVITINYCPMA